MNSVRSDFKLTLGLVTLPVSLYSVIPSDTGTKMRTLCAKHKIPIKQQFVCPEDLEVFPETVKGHERTKNEFVIPTATYEPLPKNDGIEFVAVPTGDLETRTVPGETMYYLKPTASAIKAWEVLYRLTQDTKRTLVGQTAIREGSRKIYRLVSFNDFLVMQEMVFPEHMRPAPPDASHPTIERDLMNLAKQALDAATISWEQFDSKDEGLSRFEQYVATGEVTRVTTEEQQATSTPIDLLEALKRSVEQAKQKK